MNEIAKAIAALGPGPLEEEALRCHIDPLFSRVLCETHGRIYLANHSLGRPLDRMAADVEEGLALWYANLDEAWDGWLAEIASFRTRVAALIGADGPHCIVPKTNAGQGLRAVLNCFNERLKVAAPRSEFSSVDVILKAYAARHRIETAWITPREGRRYREEDFARILRGGADLLILSLVFFDTGQVLTEIETIVAMARAQGTLVLVDLYHAAGALPVDVASLDVDFAIGGGYKYIRGGPGAAWLYINPRHLDGSLKTLDIGWFATAKPFGFAREETPHFAPGADGWLDSTPAVLPFYQTRAGLEFTLQIGVDRLRTYSQQQQAMFLDMLADEGLSALEAGEPHGAFIVIAMPQAEAIAARLCDDKLVTDAREGLLRICPDILTTPAELKEAAWRLARQFRAA
jgi:kynureninase